MAKKTLPPAKQLWTMDNAPTPAHSPAKMVWWTRTESTSLKCLIWKTEYLSDCNI